VQIRQFWQSDHPATTHLVHQTLVAGAECRALAIAILLGGEPAIALDGRGIGVPDGDARACFVAGAELEPSTLERAQLLQHTVEALAGGLVVADLGFGQGQRASHGKGCEADAEARAGLEHALSARARLFGTPHLHEQLEIRALEAWPAAGGASRVVRVWLGDG
jgi:hypothetical protein